MALDQISQLYQDVLGREADTGGLQFWTNALNSGTSIGDIRNAFLGSDEYKAKQQQPAAAPQPVQGGLASMPTNTPVNQNPPAFDPVVMDTFQPTRTGPSATPSQVISGLPNANQNQIAQLYQNTLGRQADAEGLNYWTNALNNGASIGDIRNAFLASDEYKNIQQPAPAAPITQTPAPVTAPTPTAKPSFDVAPAPTTQVAQLYQNILGRQADAEGLNYWTSALNNGASIGDIQNAFLASDEYRNKQTNPQPTSVNPSDIPWITTNQTPDGLQINDAQSVTPSVGRPSFTEGIGAGINSAVNSFGAAVTGMQPTISSAVNDLSNPEATVTKYYQNHLGRTPDQEGLNYWVNAIRSGSSLQDVEAAIQNSSESTSRQAVTNAYKSVLGRDPDAEGLANWTNEITSGKMTADQMVNALRNSEEGVKYNAPQLVKDFYTRDLGREADQEGLDYWVNAIRSGQATPEQVDQAIRQSNEGGTRNAVNELYKQYLGRDGDAEGLNYWTNQLNSGNVSWNDIEKAIAKSQEGNQYAEKLYQDKLANPVQYFGDIYARDQYGNLVRNEATDYYGNTTTVDGYQRGNYGFDTGWRQGENWDQYQNRVTGYYGDAVGKMYQGILGRPVTQDELNNLIKNYTQPNGYYYNTQQWTDLELERIQKDLALSPEAQAYAAKNGTWLTVTKDQTTTKNSGWGDYQVTEPVTKAVYIPPSVAALPSAMKDIYKSDNPQALIDSIKNDPNAYLKQQLIDDARTVGWNMGIINHYRGPGLGIHAWSNPDEYGGDYNAQMTAVNENAQKAAEILLQNGAMTQDEISNLWKTNSEQAGRDVENGVLAQIHTHGGNGFIGSIANFGDHFGDFLEKYEVAIMASILGGAVLGPLAGAAAEFGGGAALAGATGAGAALPSVSTLAGYAALAGTAGATSTAVALASGAPTNKALMAGGLAAAGVGLGGALGPSGLNVAGTLTNLGMPPVLSAVTVGALSGGALGALSGAASGNIGEGALSGALAGGISSGTNAATKTFDGLTGTLTRLAAGTAVGALAGKDISSAFQAAAVGTVVGLATSGAAKAIKSVASGATDVKSESYKPNDADVADMRAAMENQLVKQLGEGQIDSIRAYVDALPISAFKDALSAVDGEVVRAIGEAAAYPQEAVKQLYVDNLGREPDAAGLKYWTDALRNGTPLDQIQASIQNSDEALKKVSYDGSVTNNTKPYDIHQIGSSDMEPGTVFTNQLTGKQELVLNGGATVSYDDYMAAKNSGAPISVDGQLGTQTNVTIYGVADVAKTGQGETQPKDPNVANWFAKQSPEVKDFYNTLVTDPSYINPETKAPYTPAEAMATATAALGDSSSVNVVDESGAGGSFIDGLKSIGALLGLGTSDPNAIKNSLFGYGASGWSGTDGFQLIAFDNPLQKQQAVTQFNAVLMDNKATPTEKLLSKEIIKEIEKAPVKETKTTGGEKAGSQTLENNQTTGGQSGGGGDSASKAPSGQPGADAASLGAQAAVEYQAITNNTVTSKQVTDMLNPSSAAAQAASAIVPGSLSIAKIQDDVNVMYNTFLGRAAEKEGLEYWANAVANGQLTLAQVASAIANSEEGKAKAASGSGSSSTATSDTGAGTKNTTTDTGTTTAGTETGTAGTGTNTGTNGAGTGTDGGTGGGAGTDGTGTGTGAGTDGTGAGAGTGSSTGSGTGGNGTGTGSGTGSGSGGGGSGGGTGGGSGTGGFSLAQYQQPSLFGLGKGHDIAADVIGGGTKIDLGGRFEAPMLSAMNYAPINYVPAGGLMYATGGLVGYDDETDQNLSADTAGQDSDADIFSGGTAEIDLGGVFKGQPQTYPQQRGYAEGGHVPEFYSEGGLSNRYVNGAGDGTSDDVPAMLATGEFVIPADVVAALGNGSNDAGANVLDELLEVIREHKQAHDPKELPPDSLGPLAYLNKAMKKAGK